MSKDFWNLPVNPVWHVPGFMKGGKADNERGNPVLLPLVPEFINICISHLQFLHFQKFFVRGRRDWEKKCRIGIWHSPSSNRYGFAKIVTFFLCPFCIVMPTSGERGGEFSGGKGGELEVRNDDGWWWDELLFTFFTQWHSEGSRMTQC